MIRIYTFIFYTFIFYTFIFYTFSFCYEKLSFLRLFLFYEILDANKYKQWSYQITLFEFYCFLGLNDKADMMLSKDEGDEGMSSYSIYFYFYYLFFPFLLYSILSSSFPLYSILCFPSFHYLLLIPFFIFWLSLILILPSILPF